MKRNSYSELLKILPEQSKDAIMSTLSILPQNLREFLSNKVSLENEKFLSDPVFEPMFSYKTDDNTFEELAGKLLERSFVNVLDKATEYRFSKTMHPYIHQLKSWQTLLNTNNSLVVSSGTGSGKTECFMIPIISDLVRQSRGLSFPLEGVQALFIYPLNALIQNQKERFSEWTRPYEGKIRFCLYNGLLPNENPNQEQKKSLEEVIDRQHLRLSPPPLLITNTTMLEYMLIRANDRQIIDKSKGKLKYIILDEAHTYIGSQAAELSLLLKRVLDSFEVKAKDVKFIATSATIGSINAELQLKQFLSSISGVSEANVEVVFGKNEIPNIMSDKQIKSLSELQSISDPDTLIKELKNNKFACELRSFFISDDGTRSFARSLSEICEKFKISKENATEWLDLLSVTPYNEMAFLPLRLHLFHKTFPGIWACCNKDCAHKDNIDGWQYGKIYLKEQCVCDCGAPVFRVKACSNCGNPFLEAKMSEDYQTGKKYLYPTMLQNIDEFSLEDDENNVEDIETQTVFIHNTENNSSSMYLDITDSSLSRNNENGIKVDVFENGDNIYCCDSPEIDQIKSFLPMQGAPFVLSHILPTLLNYAEPSDKQEELPHKGQKMICFTDSRQGTARLAVQMQQNAERNSFRSILLHVTALLEQEKLKSDGNGDIAELKKVYEQTKAPIILNMINERLAQQQNIFAKEYEVLDQIIKEFQDNDLKWIYNYYRDKDSIFDADKGKRNLIEILFARELLRRPKKANNVETLGLLATVYDFSKVTKVPDTISRWFNLDEWKNFLKILIDFYIRANGYVQYPENWDKWGALQRSNKALEWENWPTATKKKKKNKNIINLLSYALDLNTDNDFNLDILNQIMKEAWNALTVTTGILTPSTNKTYKLDIGKIGLTRPKQIYICPKTNKALDVVLKGYSPYSSNKNTPKCERYNFPIYDFKNELGKSYEECIFLRREWLESNLDVQNLKKLGLWSNVASSIILGNRYFRTAEHSAQQSHKLLKRYEGEFKDGKINVLNCSTTMEMGVDIGGITIATMNNVPPHPANYLQRAGRAGRRRETKAISFTLCKDNAHDQYVFTHPKWAFESKINAPYVDKYSFIVLQRHINSLLLSYYFDSIKGQIDNAPNLKMEWLMLPKGKNKLTEFKQFCKDAIRTNSRVQSAIQSLIDNTHYEHTNFDAFVSQLEILIENMQKKWFSEYDAIQEQKKREKDHKISLIAIKNTEIRLINEYLLKELIEYGILPRYGFPINIVTFDTNNRYNIENQRNRISENLGGREDNLFKRRELPSRDICTALREYAPGSDVVIDGLVYKSAGITLNWHIPASEAEVKEIQSIRYLWQCGKCGASGTSASLLDIHCDVCGEEINRKNIKKYIQPAGFSVDFNSPVNNNVSVQHFVNLCEPLITAHNDLNNYLGLPYIKYKNDKEGSVIHYSNGGGNGYILCLECGRVVANNKSNLEDFKKLHYRLRSGNNFNTNNYKIECNHSAYSIVEDISLGVEMKTDVLELILSDIHGEIINDKTIAYSLAVAIRSGIAKYMNIETDEIGCGVKEIKIVGTNKKGFAIELFDKNASGYCSSNDIIKNLSTIFTYAKRTLTCDCAQSCNKCILQNDTKYNYQYLDRQKALEFLTDEWIAKNTLAENMKIFGDTTVIASASIESLIEDTPNIKELYLIIPEKSEDEDCANSPLYRLVNRYNAKGVKTILCLDNQEISADVEETLSLLAKYNNISLKSIPAGLNKNIMAVVNDGNSYYAYGSFDNEVKQLNPYWGSNVNTSILSGYLSLNEFDFSNIELKGNTNTHFDKMYNILSEVNGSGILFGQKLLEILAESLDNGINSKIKKITYKDRYIKNPLSCGLFFNFIKELKNIYANVWSCDKISLLTSENEDNVKYAPGKFYDEWSRSSTRKDILKKLFSTIDMQIDIQEKNKKYLEHNRVLVMELENGETINLIFDQGFSYWRCIAYNYYENMFPFEADIDFQVQKIATDLPNITGDNYPTRIFYTKV
jgi:hypothetical protein